MKRKLILIVGLCLVMCCCSCGANDDGAASKQEEYVLEEGYSRYQDGVFGYSVDFPVTWICESQAYWYASEEYEGSPDSVVMIYINSQKEDYIRVYGQHGTITTNFVVQSGYKKTELDENRELYTLESDEFFAAQLFFKDNKHLSATISMNVEVYKEHEEEIMELLKSIRSM